MIKPQVLPSVHYLVRAKLQAESITKLAERKEEKGEKEQGIKSKWRPLKASTSGGYDEDAEVWWFSVVDIVQVLTQQPDYQAARNHWKVLKNRLAKEGSVGY